MTHTSETLGELATALAKAQVEFPAVHKTRTARIKTDKGEYSYVYADLSDVLDAIRKPLADNGLTITQPIVLEQGATVLVSRLLHASGQWIESTYPLPNYSRPQEMGSAITYARRYTLCALLGITAEDDDDGQTAQRATPQQREAAPDPMRILWGLAVQKFGRDEAQDALVDIVRSHASKESPRELTPAECDRIRDVLNGLPDREPAGASA